MSRAIKNALLLLFSAAIVIFVILGLGVDIFHAIEEIFYDHQATIFTNSAFSRLTNKACLFAGVLSLFSLPFYAIKLCKKDFEIPKMIYALKYVASLLLITVLLVVVVLFFPAVWIVDGFEESLRVNFYGDCLYTHVLIPILFVLSFVLLDENISFSKREGFAFYIVLGAYLAMYVLFVYVFRTWADFYAINTVVSYLTVFGLIGIIAVFAPVPFFLNKLMLKLKNNAQPNTIETERLVLRKIKNEDTEPMFRNWASDQEVTRYVTWLPHDNVEITHAIIQEWIKEESDPKTIRYMITVKGSDEPIGMIDVVAYIDGAPEIGYILSKKQWGKGYMTEACKAFVQCLLDIGFSRIVIEANVENFASNRVIEKCGFIFTHRESKEHCSPFKPEPITVNWYEIKK